MESFEWKSLEGSNCKAYKFENSFINQTLKDEVNFEFLEYIKQKPQP
jgi:hypothetical protein